MVCALANIHHPQPPPSTVRHPILLFLFSIYIPSITFTKLTVQNVHMNAERSERVEGRATSHTIQYYYYDSIYMYICTTNVKTNRLLALLLCLAHSLLWYPLTFSMAVLFPSFIYAL